MAKELKPTREVVQAFYNSQLERFTLHSCSKPTVIFVTGVSGSGKSTFIGSLDKKMFLTIQADNYRKLHPELDKLIAKHGRDHAHSKTGHYSFEFAKALRDLAIAQQLNIVYESTFGKLETAFSLLEPFQVNGYQIIIVTLPIDTKLSQLRNQQRYNFKQQLLNTLPRQATEADVIKMASGYVATLEQLSTLPYVTMVTSELFLERYQDFLQQDYDN